MSFEGSTLVDWATYARARAELGGSFIRILGYFREDGIKSVGAIETAMRANDAVALVIPAHTLKGEARQFGAEPLALLAEVIEVGARTCIETRDTPDQLIGEAAQLAPLFARTLALLEREANPPAARRPAAAGFGRRAAGLGQA